MVENYKLDDIVQMKKDHPCRKSHYWKIIRMGADIKIKCEGCGFRYSRMFYHQFRLRKTG